MAVVAERALLVVDGGEELDEHWPRAYGGVGEAEQGCEVFVLVGGGYVVEAEVFGQVAHELRRAVAEVPFGRHIVVGLPAPLVGGVVVVAELNAAAVVIAF